MEKNGTNFHQSKWYKQKKVCEKKVKEVGSKLDSNKEQSRVLNLKIRIKTDFIEKVKLDYLSIRLKYLTHFFLELIFADNLFGFM